MAEDVCDLGFAEAGGVVLEGNLEFGFVDLETAEAVRVGKFTERTELIVSERGLEFEFGFEECHGGIIAKKETRGTKTPRGEDECLLVVAIEERFLHCVARHVDTACTPRPRSGRAKSRATPVGMTDGGWGELKTRDLTQIGDRGIYRGRGYGR